MITYGCRKEDQAATATRWRRMLELTKIPAQLVVHRSGGIGIYWTVPGRGLGPDRLRSQAHWALMDAQGVLGVGMLGAFSSTCPICGCTCLEYDHTPEFCRAIVTLAGEWDVPLRFVLAQCPDCRMRFGLGVARDGRRRLFTGVCDRCSGRLLAGGRA